MKLKFNLVVFLLSLAILNIILSQPTFASIRCETQYGGGQVCIKTGELQINKKVWDPQSKAFIDNLGITSYKFTAGEDNLEPGESETREIKAKVVSIDKLPGNKTLVCEVNTAEGWTNDEKDKDTAQICIEKRILGVTQLPPTGPKGWLTISLLSLLSGLLTIYFLKISQKKIQREVKI